MTSAAIDDRTSTVTEMPRLAVFHDLYSASIFEVLEGARDLCRIVWVVGWSPDEPPRRSLSRFGEIVELAGMNESESVEHLIAARPDGVVLFSDPPLNLAAGVAERLGLPFHSPRTARLLSDKVAQRTALQEAGLPVPVFAAIRRGDSDAHVPFPAVLKPRAGAGARDTFRIEDEHQLAEALARCDPDEAFILEEWLADRTAQQGLAADMVCVESLVHRGVIEHITITGRFPMAPPFRATGSFIPSNLATSDWDAVLAVTGAAIEALQVNHGLVNTDVKMTPAGPRIIEINGRLGGNVGRMISRLGGPSMFTYAMRLALGQDVAPLPAIDHSQIAFYNLVLAPMSAHEVVDVTGVQQLQDAPGIDEIRVNRQPGDALNPLATTQLDHVVRIDGMVESYAELEVLVHERVPSTLELKFDE